MPDWGPVMFSCRKCGKPITRPSAKSGQVFSCSACEAIQKTPGIATQHQATEAQFAIIGQARRRHLVGIALFPIASVIAQTLPKNSDQATFVMCSPFLLVTLGWFFLLIMEVKSIECLGGRASTSFGLFFILGPVWLVRSIVSLTRVHQHYKRLSRLGPRP